MNQRRFINAHPNTHNNTCDTIYDSSIGVNQVGLGGGEVDVFFCEANECDSYAVFELSLGSAELTDYCIAHTLEAIHDWVVEVCAHQDSPKFTMAPIRKEEDKE